MRRLALFLMLIPCLALGRDPVVEIRAKNSFSETVRIAVDEDYWPYSYRNRAGEITGHDIEYLNELANEAKLNLELKPMRWEKCLDAVAHGEVDAVAGCERMLSGREGEVLDTTAPYLVTQFSVFSRRQRSIDIDDLFGKRIAVVKNAHVGFVMTELGLENELVFFDSNREALMSVESMSCDFAIMRHDVAFGIIYQERLGNVHECRSVSQSYVCIGVAKQKDRMRHRLDHAIASLKIRGGCVGIHRKWLTSFVQPRTFSDIILAYPWFVVTMVALIIITLASFALWFRQKHRMVLLRLRAEGQARTIGKMLENDRVRKAMADREKEGYLKARTFANCFLSDYVSAYHLDLKNDSYTVFKMSGKLGDDYGKIIKYSESIEKYIRECVHLEDRVLMLDAVKPDYIRARLRNDDRYELVFRDIVTGGASVVWLKMEIVRGEDEDHAGLSFRDISARMRSVKARENMLSALSSTYISAFRVDLDTGEFTTIRVPNTTKTMNGSLWTPALEAFAGECTPETRDTVLKLADLSFLRSEASKGDFAEYTYANDRIAGLSPWRRAQMQVLERTGGRAKTVMMSFMVINAAEAFGEHEDQGLDTSVMDMNGILRALCYGLGANLGYISRRSLSDGSNYIEKGFAVLPDGKANGAEYKLDRSGIAAEVMDLELGGVISFDQEDIQLIADGYGLPADHPMRNGKRLEMAPIYVEAQLWGSVNMIFDDEHVQTVEDADILRTAAQVLGTLIERRIAGDELRTALKIAEDASRSKTTFLFNMSHDIRTPMNAIIGFTEIAERHLDNKERLKDCLDKARTASEHLLELINEILDMSRIESGTVVFEDKPAIVSDFMSDLDSVMQALAREKGVGLTFRPAEVVGEYVRLDEAHLRQVLMNLISNAVKYTPKGGSVEVGLVQSGADYVFTVTDTGIGMSEDFLRRLFTPFAREQSSTLSGVQGTGLGMTIVKRLVELMNGELGIKSERGKGTVVTVSVPLKSMTRQEYESSPEVVSAARKDAVVADAAKRHRFDGCRVLVVEDNEINREITVEMLEELGVKASTVENGEIALKILTSGEGAFDLVFMDIQMPVMDGYEATRRYRAWEKIRGGRLPIVALSANAFAEDRAASIDAGMDEHLAKPVKVGEITEILARYLKK